MNRNTPLLFKTETTGASIKTNATFIREVGFLNGDKIIGIFYQGEEWLVKAGEVKTVEQVLLDWRSEIVKLKPLYKTKTNLAKALGISPKVLNKRIALSFDSGLV